MVQSLQKKFMTAAMLAVTILLLVLVAGINTLNAVSVRRGQDLVLEELLQRGSSSSAGPVREDRGVLGLLTGGRAMRESGFFLVWYDAEGTVLSVEDSRIFSLEDGQAQDLAARAYAAGRESGRLGEFRYRMRTLSDTGEDGPLDFRAGSGGREAGKGPFGQTGESTAPPENAAAAAAFLNISQERQQVLSFLLISVMIALLCGLLMILPVRLLSLSMIRPIAENMQRQREFVTNAGHEIKTPLAIIQANADALELRTGQTRWSRNIKDQTRRLSDLMQNLLTLSRMDEVDLRLEKETFDLAEAAREAWKPFAQIAENRGIRCSLDLPEEASVLANRQSLLQLFSILFDNAVKYTDEGGQIDIVLRREGKETLFRQSNSCGSGDLPKDPARLFDRFYRPDSSRSRERGGSGIGLSAALAIAKANGASLTARRTEEGRIEFVLKIC